MCLGPLPEPKIDESNVTWYTFPPHDHDDISFDLEFKCSNVCRVVVKGTTWQLKTSLLSQHHISDAITSCDAILTLDVNIPGQVISIEHFNEKGELQKQMLDCPFNNETLLRFSQVNQQVIKLFYFSAN